jgi:hypothetical protein
MVKCQEMLSSNSRLASVATWHCLSSLFFLLLSHSSSHPTSITSRLVVLFACVAIMLRVALPAVARAVRVRSAVATKTAVRSYAVGDNLIKDDLSLQRLDGSPVSTSELFSNKTVCNHND